MFKIIEIIYGHIKKVLMIEVAIFRIQKAIWI
jgi:hypothetical protein